MNSLLDDPHVVKLVRAWRRHPRGARLLLEHFNGDDTAAIDFLNSHFTLRDAARDLAQEPPAEREAVLSDLKLYLATPKGVC